MYGQDKDAAVKSSKEMIHFLECGYQALKDGAAVTHATTTKTSIAPVGACPALTADYKNYYANLRKDPTAVKKMLVVYANDIKS